MSDFDSFFQTSDQLEGTDYTFVDADTLRDKDDNRYRLQGYDAPEISKLRGDEFTTGTAGGGLATQEIMNLANTQGFTNVVKTGEFDPNGREIIELHDSRGRNFASEIFKSGVLDTGRYTTQEDLVGAEVGRVLRDRDQYENTDWDKAASNVQQAIADETLYDTQFKQQAVSEGQLASAPHLYSGVQWRQYDRTLDNKAVNPLSESFDVGLTGAAEGLFGTLELIGESTDWDWAKDIGEAGIVRARSQLADKPQLKLSAIDDDGNWDIDSVGEFWEYLSNNAAISLPYMAASIGGALAAPYTAGLSLSLPASIYTGQVWNEMEGEKNAGVAIAAGVTQAVLDRIGLAGITGGSILKKETRDLAISKLVQSSGGQLSKKEASNILAGYTRKEIANVVGDLGKTAAQQITARNVARGFAQRAGVGGLGEATTEALQETTGYLAAVHGSDKQFDANDLTNRIVNATLAGGTLGASFSVPGTLYDTGAWADLAVRQAPADQARASQAGKWAQDEIAKFGRVKSVQELTADLDSEVVARGDNVLSWQERIGSHKKAVKERSAFESATALWGAVPGLWRGAVRHIIPQPLKDQSRALRKLSDMFGGGLQKTFSGAHFENRKHHMLTEYKNSVPDPIQIADNLGFKNFRKDRGAMNQVLTRFGEVVKASEATGQIDWDNLPQDLAPYRQFLGAYFDAYKKLGDKMYADQKKYNPDLGYINNYLFHYKSFNKGAIEKNRAGFVDALVNKGVPREEAIKIADEILNADTINGPADFHVGHGKQIPGSHRARTLNLADDVNFNEWMENDFFNNVSNAAKSAARYIAYQEFIGDDNAKINELLQQALDEGVPPAEVNRIASQFQDYLDAESGNYKRIQNPHWNKIQQNLLFWTSMAGLPLATISSFVELALTTRALTSDQIFGHIGKAAKLGAQEIFGALNLFDNKTNREKAKRDRNDDIADLGYFNWEVGAAHTTGVTQAGHAKQQWLDFYFRAIGLQQWTDYTRQVRASIAGDYIGGRLETINNQRQNGELYTNEIQEAEEQLRNIGINVDDMITLMNNPGQLSDAEAQVMADNMREGMFNFVNEAVALPQSGNRPLFYQNPHLALFTQFQGFIATFTANHIPKMWGELVSRGTPAMKYNAFAVMTTMIALGFVSQYLKDLLKYGEASPYLEDAEKFQRALGASGLLGTGERVLSFVNPIYQKQSDGPVDWVFDTLLGESAAASNIQRGAKGLATLPVDPEKGLYNILKTTPFTGPLNESNKWVAETIFGGE